jgi:hypothetical protein
MKSVGEIITIVANGGGVILDASRYNTGELITIVANAKKGQVILKNADKKSTGELITIAANGGSNILLDLT